MNNICVWISIGVVSILFGFFSRVAAYKIKLNKTTWEKVKKWAFENGVSYWLFEAWRDSMCYFITGVTAYFMVAIRGPVLLRSDGVLSISDFVLFLIFSVGVLGWLPYLIKNITEGINTIVEKFLRN